VDALAPSPVDRFTLVSFHAHPDDEALLTGGTLAKASAAGHRVVLVTATCGERGLAGPEDGRGADLARVRMSELRAAAAALGCARVVTLGYGDSGLRPDPGDAGAFARVDIREAAARLAAVLEEEHADVLTVYDRNGGYGHPDHIQVHRVGTLAARLAGTPVVLEATVPGGAFRAALALSRVLGRGWGGSAPLGTRRVFSDRRQITHRIPVGGFLDAKRAAMAAHASQRRDRPGDQSGDQSGDRSRAAGRSRSLERVLRLPPRVFALAFGREWFVEQGRPRGGRQLDDVFATLRGHDRVGTAPEPGRT
jgi:LmbE family N-acetylglucosaminyl deacetylase